MFRAADRKLWGGDDGAVIIIVAVRANSNHNRIRQTWISEHPTHIQHNLNLDIT